MRGIDFEVETGGCVGLLGPNGAGKTTTMRMVMGLSTVSDGRLDVFGVPVIRPLMTAQPLDLWLATAHLAYVTALIVAAFWVAYRQMRKRLYD